MSSCTLDIIIPGSLGVYQFNCFLFLCLFYIGPLPPQSVNLVELQKPVELDASWQPPSEGSCDSYTVEITETETLSRVLSMDFDGSISSHEISGLKPGTEYELCVACNFFQKSSEVLCISETTSNYVYCII